MKRPQRGWYFVKTGAIIRAGDLVRIGDGWESAQGAIGTQVGFWWRFGEVMRRRKGVKK